MKTSQNYFSEKSRKCIDLEKMSKRELLAELIYLRKKHDCLMSDWAKQHENKRHIIENILKTVGIFGINSFDETEREDLEKFFDVLFS